MSGATYSQAMQGNANPATAISLDDVAVAGRYSFQSRDELIRETLKNDFLKESLARQGRYIYNKNSPHPTHLIIRGVSLMQAEAQSAVLADGKTDVGVARTALVLDMRPGQESVAFYNAANEQVASYDVSGTEGSIYKDFFNVLNNKHRVLQGEVQDSAFKYAEGSHASARGSAGIAKDLSQDLANLNKNILDGKQEAVDAVNQMASSAQIIFDGQKGGAATSIVMEYPYKVPYTLGTVKNDNGVVTDSGPDINVKAKLDLLTGEVRFFVPGQTIAVVENHTMTVFGPSKGREMSFLRNDPLMEAVAKKLSETIKNNPLVYHRANVDTELLAKVDGKLVNISSDKDTGVINLPKGKIQGFQVQWSEEERRVICKYGQSSEVAGMKVMQSFDANVHPKDVAAVCDVKEPPARPTPQRVAVSSRM